MQAIAEGDSETAARARRRFFILFFLIMSAFRDSIFISGPIFAYRLEGSVKSGGLYASTLLFGGMLSFLIMGVLLDRFGWARIAKVSVISISLASILLSVTVLGALPYQRELDILLMLVIFFFGSTFYLLPDILINRYLRAADRPEAHSHSTGLFPAISLMLSSAVLFLLGKCFGDRALGMLLALAGLTAVSFLVYLVRLEDMGPLQGVQSSDARAQRVGGVLAEWISGFRFIVSDPAMRMLLVFTCCVALAIGPHQVFITAVMQSTFKMDDGGVAIAQFVFALARIVAAWSFPFISKKTSLLAVGFVAIAAMIAGNGLAALVLFQQRGASAQQSFFLLYLCAHVAIFVGFTFATSWNRIVRGKRTPLQLLGRMAGAMSTIAQLCGLAFSLSVTFAGTALATYIFYMVCAVVATIIGVPALRAVARRVEE